MPTSPNVLNYFIGKGTISFTPLAGSPRDLGNAPAVKLTPNVTKLDHFSSRQGVKKKDLSVVTEQTLTLDITLDEITIENLAMLLAGTVGADTDGFAEFGIMTVSEIVGSILFTGTNDVGQHILMLLPSVSFGPSAGLDLISDAFGEIQLVGDVLQVAGSFGNITIVP